MVKEIHGAPHDMRIAAFKNWDLLDDVDALDAVRMPHGARFTMVSVPAPAVSPTGTATHVSGRDTKALCATPCTAPQSERDTCSCP